ncbi:MAG: hypothetical protein ABI775_01990 [Pseudonocardiales bacterium]|nr:hypothetical protein [Actinomycetota bacterium]MDQ2965518.1 hypothetical protein [Chloroflexota bacterium]
MDGGQEQDNSQPRRGETAEPEYLDRSKLDFDPDDGLYTGTAVEGTTEIPGPHEKDADHDKPGDVDQ